MPHEALDSTQARMPAIAEPLRHRALEVEAQALLGPVGQDPVQVVVLAGGHVERQAAGDPLAGAGA